jgi:aryl-alcohol dehydrogenase-like predicted oxidoreductase
MDHSFLGRTGVRASRLAFGTMSFAGDADETTSAALYARARDAGINLFDCADAYANGEAERVLGRLIAGHRDEIVLTTKAYFPIGAKGPNDRGSSRLHLRKAVEGSLKRLGTDRIDVFFLHRWDDITHPEETFRALDDLVRQGKILYPALSNFSAWQTQFAVDLCDRHGWARPVCVQPMYNLVKRQAEVEIIPQAAFAGLGVLPYSPLAAGLLTGKYGRDRAPGEGRILSNPIYTTRYQHDLAMDIAERFTAFAAERGVSPVALAIAWVADHPDVTAPLIGARNLRQLNGCLEAADLHIDEELRRAIAALSPAPPPATDRNEEGTGVSFGAR